MNSLKLFCCIFGTQSCSDEVACRIQACMNFKDAAVNVDLKGLQHNLATDSDQLGLDALECKDKMHRWEIDVERRIRRRRRLADELPLGARLLPNRRLSEF